MGGLYKWDTKGSFRLLPVLGLYATFSGSQLLSALGVAMQLYCVCYLWLTLYLKSLTKIKARILCIYICIYMYVYIHIYIYICKYDSL